MLWRNSAIAVFSAASYCYLYDALPLYPLMVAGGGVLLFAVLSFLFDPLVYITSHDKFRSGDTRRRPGNIPPVYPNGWYAFEMFVDRDGPSNHRAKPLPVLSLSLQPSLSPYLSSPSISLLSLSVLTWSVALSVCVLPAGVHACVCVFWCCLCCV